MNLRRIRFLLWLAAASSLAAGVVVVVLTAVLPLNANDTADTLSKAMTTDQTRLHSLVKPTLSFDAVMDADLRHLLIDPPPVTVSSSPTQAPPSAAPQFQLLGTVIEPGHSVALFAGPAGRPEFKSVGDSVADAIVVDIHEEVVTLRRNNKPIVVTMRATTMGGAGTSPIATPSVATQPALAATSGRPVLPAAADDEDEAAANLRRLREAVQQSLPAEGPR